MCGSRPAARRAAGRPAGWLGAAAGGGSGAATGRSGWLRCRSSRGASAAPLWRVGCEQAWRGLRVCKAIKVIIPQDYYLDGLFMC